MKICNHCGAQLNDNAKFCAKCGNQVTEKQAAPVKKQKSMKPFIIGCCVLIGAMVIGTGAFVAFKMLKPQTTGIEAVDDEKEEKSKKAKKGKEVEESATAPLTTAASVKETAASETTAAASTAATTAAATETAAETAPVFAETTAAAWSYPTTPTTAPTQAYVPAQTAAVPVNYITYYVVNCNESITLRTSASTSAGEICQIPLGAAVSYVESAPNGFYKIIYNGNTGYGLASYLSQDKPSVSGSSSGSGGTYRTFIVVNCNESITLRTSASTSASEICQIPLGSAVSYVESAANGFYKVIYNGHTGYALASYLEEY